jgi:hypothetical protein
MKNLRKPYERKDDEKDIAVTVSITMPLAVHDQVDHCIERGERSGFVWRASILLAALLSEPSDETAMKMAVASISPTMTEKELDAFGDRLVQAGGRFFTEKYDRLGPLDCR